LKLGDWSLKVFIADQNPGCTFTSLKINETGTLIHVIKKQNQARSYNITPVSKVFILLQAPTVESHDHMGEPNEENALR
jgi:hypothetical protein